MANTGNNGNAGSNAMWGGRFAGGVCAIMEGINSSIDVDKRLYAEDIEGSIAHCQMLASRNIISASDAGQIVEGLRRIKEEIESGQFQFSVQLEDIHMNIEARLAEMLGKDLAGRLHTGRSRNDQVAVDFRLWMKRETKQMVGHIDQLMGTLLAKAEQHVETIMPGFTHLQCAQPITFGHHCMAYVEMLGRDRSRANDALERMDECPLGAGALAGTSFPIDRHMTATTLGFREPTRNSLDSVSDRDFALEFLSFCAICAAHLSRLAEELILWATPQFGFVRLSDAFSTGSSIMPQKRNADAAELVRAKTGRINGNLISLLTVLKALPLSYAKDLQEDKQIVFDSADTLGLMLQAMAGMVADMTVNGEAMNAAASVGFSTATDLADWLVAKAGLPFRQAHHIAGQSVALAERKGAKTLAELSLQDLQQIHPAIRADVFEVMSTQSSVNSRTSFGGTATGEVRKQIAHWRSRLEKKE